MAIINNIRHMEKFFRYIFILLAILFVVFFLWPSSRHRATPQGFYSPVDKTQAMEPFLYYHKGASRWEEAHYVKNECRSTRRNCGIHPFRYGIDKIFDLSDSFSRKSIEYKEAKEELDKEWLETNKGMPFDDLPGLKRVLQLGEPLYEDYMNSQRIIIKYLTWALTLFVILIGSTLIIFRVNLARWACGLLRISANTTGKTARKFHDNI